jgi:hypothetical protein
VEFVSGNGGLSLEMRRLLVQVLGPLDSKIILRSLPEIMESYGLMWEQEHINII